MSRQLHHSNKKERRIYTEKLIFLSAAVVLSLFLSILAGKKFVNAHGDRQNDPVRFQYYTSIQVQKGDTLWDIAEAYHDEDTSLRDYIQELKEINQLDSDIIQEGRYLTVTYYDQEFH